MPRPTTRDGLPRRSIFNEKRRLADPINPSLIAKLRPVISYHGYAKHKANPHAYGLTGYSGRSGDRTLCDRHAHFLPNDMPTIPVLLQRALSAGLVGHAWESIGPRMMWTVADSGWIFELKETNPVQADYHGYPLLPGDPMAKLVYDRFAAAAISLGDQALTLAAANCRARYRLKT